MRAKAAPLQGDGRLRIASTRDRFEDSLPDVASRSLGRRGEVGRTTITRTIVECRAIETDARHGSQYTLRPG
jgi:hypothetical protein